MDCSDAILSRRPLEDRQRILKDSHTGAFAVISIVFYILAYFAFTSTAITIGIDFANMILLVCLSRSVSGLHVLIAKPMQTSQYAKMNPASEAAPVPADDDFSAVNPAAIKAEAAADPAGCLYLATMRKLKQTLTRHPRISRRPRLAIRLQLHRRLP